MSKGRRGYKGPRKYRPGAQPTYWQTEAYNQQLFTMFQSDLIELALSRFRWVNLPETCNERFLEWTLLTEGPRRSRTRALAIRCCPCAPCSRALRTCTTSRAHGARWASPARPISCAIGTTPSGSGRTARATPCSLR